MSTHITRNTHTIDATDRPLGRLASEIAQILRGKHKPSFEPHIDGGDMVVITNAKYIKLTGKKVEQKEYHRSTLYPSGIRTTYAKDLIQTDPAKMIKMAVRLMLPATTHRSAQMRRLKIEL